MDERTEQYLSEIDLFKNMLSKVVSGLNSEQLIWVPPGITNGIGWIVRHCADEFWFCYGLLSGCRVPVNLNQSGFPTPTGGFQFSVDKPSKWGVLSFDFDHSAAGPGPTGPDYAAYITTAWHELRGFVIKNYPEWSTKSYLTWRGVECTGWYFLEHFLLDTAWHAGQASYLRKIMASGK